MLLGIEIGGTKLQLGVGPGDGTLVAIERHDVKAKRGAEGILAQIETTASVLIARHAVSAVGIGFGGPVDSSSLVVVKSHHVAGWDNFPIVEWTQSELGVPTILGNDCDVAALAEACFGAGRLARSVFYATVGTGIGGGLVLDRQIHGTDRPAAAEIGHLRPGLDATSSSNTVEALAAGPGIALATRAGLTRLLEREPQSIDVLDLLARCQGNLDLLTT